MLDFYEEKRNLAQEILTKAGLEHIAEYVDEIEEFNLIGSSPKTMFGGLPIKILRCLNTEQGILILKSEHARERLPEYFKKAPVLFESRWNLCQCLFWMDVSEYYKIIELRKEIIEVLRMLKWFETRDDYEKYKEYYLNREEIGKDACLPLAPNFYEREEAYEKAEYILECIRNKEYLNHLLYQQYARCHSCFEHHDEKFDIVILKNLNEFWQESEKQCNCVWNSNYVEETAQGRKVILSLRQRGKIRIPYIIIEIEISDGYFTIMQAKGKYNSEADDEVKMWIRKYCEERAVRIDKKCEDLILDHIKAERRKQRWDDWCFDLLG